MGRFTRVRPRWVVVALACAAAAALVFVSEASYRQSVDALDALGTHAAAGHERLYRSLLLGRAGIAALSVLSLAAVLLTLRKSLARIGAQQQRQDAARAERDALERAVIERTAELTDLARHLQTAREDERSRLARDLHDELGALLTSAKLDAARLRSRLSDREPDTLERLEHLVLTLNRVIALKRRIIEDLRPSALTNLGLVATLEILAREFAQTSGIAVHCSFVAVHLDPRAELVAYRVVQEAITNITKYARARNVWLDLSHADGTVQISVQDDGVGFLPSATGGSAHGLIGMRYRVEAEGGQLTVQSEPGHDTLIRACLPESAAP